MNLELKTENARVVQNLAEAIMRRQIPPALAAGAVARVVNPMTFRQFVMVASTMEARFEASDVLKEFAELVASPEWREPRSREEMIGFLADSPGDGDCRGVTPDEAEFLFDLWSMFEAVLLVDAQR